MTGDAFPGFVFRASGGHFDPNDEEFITTALVKCGAASIVQIAVHGMAAEDQENPSLIWCLNITASLDDVPKHETDFAVSVLRDGKIVMLLCQDPLTEFVFRSGLVKLATTGDVKCK